jgi:hypothetical protein
MSADIGADMSTDIGEDPEPDGRWMTYAELADARGIDHHSARRLASRKKWRRQRDNHHLFRVYVPLEGAGLQRERADMSAGISADVSADISRVVSAFEAALAALREGKEAEITALRGQIQAMERGADGVVFALREQLEATEHRAKAAEAEVARLAQVEQSRRTRGVIARLRGAWRRE